MPKRPNPRAVKASRSYEINEAAKVLGVTTGTIRLWIRQGLRAMTAQRPYLILGADLRDFLVARRAAAKRPLLLDQLYCFGCKLGQQPAGMLVTLTPLTAATSMLKGRCAYCGRASNRIAGNRNLKNLALIFTIENRADRAA